MTEIMPGGEDYAPCERKDGYVRQIGSHKQCAKPACTVRPSWRIIFGHWNMQGYTCQRHLTWGCELDMLSESTGTALGWQTGYPAGSADTPAWREIRETRITPMLPAIMRVDYGREVTVSASFPKYEVISASDDPSYRFEIPVYE